MTFRFNKQDRVRDAHRPEEVKMQRIVMVSALCLFGTAAMAQSVSDVKKEGQSWLVAQQQSQNAGKIARLMNSIRDISVQTTEGTNQTAQSVVSLANVVRDLRDSVADFKLPEDQD